MGDIKKGSTTLLDGLIVNENAGNNDTRMEGTTNQNLFFLDASSNNIGMGTNTPHSSSILDLTSTTKGFLLPRMSQTNRNAILSPTAGLVVFNSDENRFDQFDTSWRPLNGVALVNSVLGPVGNIGIGEDDLLTIQLPANSLLGAADFIEVEAAGEFAANTNNKTVTMYFGTETIFSTGALAFDSTYWHIKAIIHRVDLTTQNTVAIFTSNDTVLQTSMDTNTTTQNLANPIFAKVTGQGTADNDVVQNMMTMKLYATLQPL